MTTLLAPPIELSTGEPEWTPDEAQLTAAAFLARYRDHTLEASRRRQNLDRHAAYVVVAFVTSGEPRCAS